MGSILQCAGQEYRLPQVLFQTVEVVEALNALDPADEAGRFKLLAELPAHSPWQESIVRKDGYLENLRMCHAAAFSLKFRTDEAGFNVDPQLYRAQTATRQQAGQAISEAQQLLPPALQDVFVRERFPKWPECHDRYSLGDNTYVYLEPEVQQALSIVRKVQDAPIETRRDFALNPQRHLKEHLPEEVVERLFIVTEEYAERVTGIEEWRARKLPWLKTEKRDWWPEEISHQIRTVGGETVTLNEAQLLENKERIEDAREAGLSSVTINGQDISLEYPANTAVFEGMLGEEKPANYQATTKAVHEKIPKNTLFASVKDNLEALTYQAPLVPHTLTHSGTPARVKATLDPHQQEGLSWLQQAFAAGYPGVLLADDMGLGKTLQALCMLAWGMEEQQSSGNALHGKPLLIVAPTGLLANWEKEAQQHLHHPFLGNVVRACGSGLKRYKTFIGGAVALDTDKLCREADCILTTYETLRDFHTCFMRIRFSVAAFDEIQKLKNPTSQLTRAAQAQNITFKIGLTGTPVENHLADLWTLMDTVYPGYLGKDLKTFAGTVKADNLEHLETLRDHLTKAQNGKPPVMLRRMKGDALKGMPNKTEQRQERNMPAAQATRYAEKFAKAKDGQRGKALEILQHLRGISLHPTPPKQAGDLSRYVTDSARLTATFEILDTIHKQGEKVLLFVELKDMQPLLKKLIAERYGIEPFIINGDVDGGKRQVEVEKFQHKPDGFDAMILSPKAGGVGLTLTRANHVIHVSRWWNPAVEDQCSDRAYRKGQQRDVTIYYPLALHPADHIRPFSFDRKLDELLAKKRALSRDLLILPADFDSGIADLTASMFGGDVFGESIDENTVTSTAAANTSALLEEVDRLSGIAFEEWVRQRLLDAGYAAKPTPRSHDAGVDIVIRPTAANSGTVPILIQCKHTGSPEKPCSADLVEKLVRARDAYADAGNALLVSVTNAKKYTSRTEREAAKYGVLLLQREHLGTLELPIESGLANREFYFNGQEL
jgi:SNF2 family DNA or RNA helicase/HJR/Mrr/RecB family endonuclease